MDELVFSTVGKLYIEISRFQKIVEAQQARITELESQVNSAGPLAKPAPKDGGRP